MTQKFLLLIHLILHFSKKSYCWGAFLRKILVKSQIARIGTPPRTRNMIHWASNNYFRKCRFCKKNSFCLQNLNFPVKLFETLCIISLVLETVQRRVIWQFNENLTEKKLINSRNFGNKRWMNQKQKILCHFFASPSTYVRLLSARNILRIINIRLTPPPPTWCLTT